MKELIVTITTATTLSLFLGMYIGQNMTVSDTELMAYAKRKGKAAAVQQMAVERCGTDRECIYETQTAFERADKQTASAVKGEIVSFALRNGGKQQPRSSDSAD